MFEVKRRRSDAETLGAEGEQTGGRHMRTSRTSPSAPWLSTTRPASQATRRAASLPTWRLPACSMAAWPASRSVIQLAPRPPLRSPATFPLPHHRVDPTRARRGEVRRQNDWRRRPRYRRSDRWCRRRLRSWRKLGAAAAVSCGPIVERRPSCGCRATSRRRVGCHFAAAVPGSRIAEWPPRVRYRGGRLRRYRAGRSGFRGNVRRGVCFGAGRYRVPRVGRPAC